MKKIDAIIFDMDGLLIDSEAMYLRSWQQVLDANDFPLTIEDVYGAIGISAEQSARYYLGLLKDLSLVEKIRGLREEAFWKLIESEGMPLKKGVIKVLELAKSKGIKLGLATSTGKVKALIILQHANIDPKMFDTMIFGDMVKESKPNPEIFLKAWIALNVSKEDCVIFEDSYNGMLAANRAEIDAIWVKDLLDLNPFEELIFYRKYTSIDEWIGEIK